jgi:hypothetical protein
MKRQSTAAAIALVAMMGATCWAQPSNKKTNLDVKETILIPGKELPPGKYVIKLMDSSSNRNIVQVFNEDETQLQATILAIPNYRLERTGDTELRYWESASGTPPALRAWFYPGDNFGQEFAYPKELAEQIAARNSARLAWYEGSGDAESLKSADIHYTDESQATQTATSSGSSAPSVESQGTADRSMTSPETEATASTQQGSAGTTDATNQPLSSSTTDQPSSSSTMSQGTTSTSPSSQPPATEESVGSADRMTTTTQQPATEPAGELPRTASPLWTIALAGAAFLALGAGFARHRRRAG